MTDTGQAPSFENPLDVAPSDDTPNDDTPNDDTLGDNAASDDLAFLQDGELVGDQEESIDTPDELGGVGGASAGGAG